MGHSCLAILCQESSAQLSFLRIDVIVSGLNLPSDKLSLGVRKAASSL